MKTLSRNDAADFAQETLKMIARLPAPEGLVDRIQAGVQAQVQARLLTVPRSRKVLAWPAAITPGGWGGALRGAAAAAIVCVVAGGGWQIYLHVQPEPSARSVVMPAPTAGSGRGFSIGGSVHTPDPQSGVVLTHQVVPEPSAPESRQPAAIMPDRAAQARKHGKGRKPADTQPTPLLK